MVNDEMALQSWWNLTTLLDKFIESRSSQNGFPSAGLTLNKNQLSFCMAVNGWYHFADYQLFSFALFVR